MNDNVTPALRRARKTPLMEKADVDGRRRERRGLFPLRLTMTAANLEDANEEACDGGMRMTAAVDNDGCYHEGF